MPESRGADGTCCTRTHARHALLHEAVTLILVFHGMGEVFGKEDVRHGKVSGCQRSFVRVCLVHFLSAVLFGF